MSKIEKVQGISSVRNQQPSFAQKLAALEKMVRTLGFNPEKLLDVSEGNLGGRKVTDHRVVSIYEINEEMLYNLIAAAARGSLAGYKTTADGVERLFMTATAKKNLAIAKGIYPSTQAENDNENGVTFKQEPLKAYVIKINLEDVEEIDEDVYFTAQVTLLGTLESIRNESKRDSKDTQQSRHESNRIQVGKSAKTTLPTEEIVRPQAVDRKKIDEAQKYTIEKVRSSHRQRELALQKKDRAARDRKIEILEKEILTEEIKTEHKKSTEKKHHEIKKGKAKKDQVSRKSGA